MNISSILVWCVSRSVNHQSFYNSSWGGHGYVRYLFQTKVMDLPTFPDLSTLKGRWSLNWHIRVSLHLSVGCLCLDPCVSCLNTMAPWSPPENVRHAGSWEVSPLSHQPGTHTTPDLSAVQPLTASHIKGGPASAESSAADRKRWTGADLLA